MMRLTGLCVLVLMAGCAGTTPQTLSNEPSTPVDASHDSTEHAPAPTVLATSAAASPEEPASKTRCCSQCSEAASKDPAGRDISMNLCSGYAGYVVNGQAPLDEACTSWFDGNPLTVLDCR